MVKKLRLHVTKDTFIRKDIPRITKDNKKGIIFKDQTIELEVEVINDESCEDINGNNTWYKDKNGDFLWSGGFSVQVNKNENISFINYSNKLIQLPDKIKKNQGKGVKIAILDSGLHFAKNGFKDGHINIHDVNDNNGLYGLSDHGTRVSGILAGDSTNFKGICPNAEIYISNITNRNSSPLINRLKSSLHWAINEIGVDIINMSFQISSASKDDELLTLFKQAKEKNIILVGAAGENTILENDAVVFLYPAMLEDCISVGSIDSFAFDKLEEVDFNPKLDFILPNKLLPTLGSSLNSTINDSSAATAIISGIAALIISDKRGNGLPIESSEIKSELYQYADHVSELIFNENNFTYYKI